MVCVLVHRYGGLRVFSVIRLSVIYYALITSIRVTLVMYLIRTNVLLIMQSCFIDASHLQSCRKKMNRYVQ